VIRRWAAIGFATLGGLAAAGQASAATTVGSNLTGGANFGLSCTTANEPSSCTFGIESLSAGAQATGGDVVSSPGVIVGWRLRHSGVYFNGGPPGAVAAVSVRLRVIRGPENAWVGAGAGAAEDLPNPAGTYEFPARLPVQTGDRIGYDLTIQGNFGIYGASPTTETTDVMRTWVPPLPEGSGGSNTAPFPEAALLMNADIEPDADGDGYGDETQDQCPTDATTQGNCPQPPDVDPPETTITKGAKDKTSKPKAKFKFTSDEPGSTFECSLKGKGLDPLIKQFNACASPRKYKKLDPGKYTFKVRATDLAGNVDPTPAKDKFKVVD
jgi:hypothetical protein